MLAARKHREPSPGDWIKHEVVLLAVDDLEAHPSDLVEELVSLTETSWWISSGWCVEVLKDAFSVE